MISGNWLRLACHLVLALLLVANGPVSAFALALQLAARADTGRRETADACSETKACCCPCCEQKSEGSDEPSEPTMDALPKVTESGLACHVDRDIPCCPFCPGCPMGCASCCAAQTLCVFDAPSLTFEPACLGTRPADSPILIPCAPCDELLHPPRA